MILIIAMQYCRFTDNGYLQRFALSIFKDNPEVNRVSFDFYGDLKTFDRKDKV
jgi:hypothetical protein